LVKVRGVRVLSLKERRTIILKRVKHGWPVTTICAHFGINRDTFYYHWNSYRLHGWEGLEVKSRRPHTVHSTPQDIVERVMEIRRLYGYGPNKIEAVLRQDGVSLGHNTIHRILVKQGLNHPLEEPRRTWGRTRFERPSSNSLWQTDFMLTEEDDWMVTYLDDHSRFVTGCRIDHDARGENAISLLRRAIAMFGAPTQILTDQGSQFVNPRGGATQFQRFCLDNDIEHVKASVRRPTTIGKLERWHRTYQEEHSGFGTLSSFVRYYNYTRPHQALSYSTPAQVYFRDLSDM